MKLVPVSLWNGQTTPNIRTKVLAIRDWKRDGDFDAKTHHTRQYVSTRASPQIGAPAYLARSRIPNPLSKIAFVTLKAVPAAALAAARSRWGLVGMRNWRTTNDSEHKKKWERGGGGGTQQTDCCLQA